MTRIIWRFEFLSDQMRRSIASQFFLRATEPLNIENRSIADRARCYPAIHPLMQSASLQLAREIVAIEMTNRAKWVKLRATSSID